MSDYTLNIIVNGVDQTGPAQQGMDRLGVGGIAAGNLIAGALQSAAGAVTSFVGSAVSAAGDFEQNLNVLQTASGATAAQMDQMRSMAVALGNDMTLPGASASDAATAMLELSKAGLSVTDTMDAAKGTLQLAAAAETDAATAAQVVSGALNAFGLSGEHATEIADQLAAGANASAASMTDLSDGFKQAGFAFNATGQSTSDLIASLAMLTNVGLTGSDAGTALKNVMLQLMAPTDAAAATMAQYGINVRDAQGNMLPFRDIIGVLQTQLGGLSAAQREAALKTILQGDGMKAMLPLLDAGVAGFDAMKAKVNEAGAAQAMAQAQMQGFNGAMGGLSNAVETLQLVIGTALLPVLTALVGIAANAINAVTTFAQALMGSADAFQSLGPVAQFVVNALQSVGQVFIDIAGQAVAWGENIVSQLAGGMMGAAGAVMEVLGSIGAMIANLLMPGSPPKLLPELDSWGAGAMTAYMEGWGQGDFSIFNSISDTIKSALDGIAKSTGNKGMNVASMVMGTQDDIAKAINEIHTLGSVSEETFNAIISAAGPAGPQVSELVRAYLDLEAATQEVASAQAELNGVMEEYAAKLDPLNAQLKGIQNQKQAIQDQQRLAKLYEEAGAAAEGSAEKRLKMLEIQELETRMQIRATEQERDTAVDAINQKLEAAKKEQAAAQQRVNAQKAMADAQNKTNALIAEQSKAMAGAAGAMKTMATAAAPVAAVVEKVNAAVETGNAVIQKADDYYQETAAAVQGISPAFQAFSATLGAIGQGIITFLTPLYQAADAIGAFAIGIDSFAQMSDALMAIFGPTLGGLIAQAVGVLNNYAQVWIDLGATIMNVVMTLVNGDLAGAWAALTSGLAQVVADYQTYAESMGALIMNIATAIISAVVAYAPLIYAQLLTWGQAFVDWITPYIPIALTYLQSYAASIWAWIVEQAPILYAQLLTWGQAFVDWITPYAGLALAVLGEWVAGLWAWVQQQAPIWLTQLLTWGQALVDWVVPYIPIALAALQEFGASVLTWVGEQAGALLASFSAWADSVVAWIPGAIVSFLGAWPGMLGSFLDWIAGAVGPILAQLGAWAIAFVQWILPMIPPFIGGLAVLAGALLGFIVETAVVIATKVVAWATSFLGWIAVNVLPVLPGLLATILASILTFIGGAVVGIALSVAGWGLAFLAWIKDVVSKIPGALAGILAAIGGWISGAAGKLVGEAAKIGQAVVDGIKQGLSNGWGKVVAWLSEKVASIPEPIRKIMGIASPSKVMAAEVGAPIVDGIVAGLVQRSPKAVQAMLDLANSMFDVVNKGVEAFGKLTQLGTIPQSAIANFGDAIMRTLTEFSQRVGQWDKAAMSAASQFTYKAGQVVDFLAKGVELLNGIAALAVPSQDAIRAFADSLAMVMSEIVRVSTFELRLGLTAGVEFASGAKAIAEMIGTGVDALNKLSDFVRPAPGVIQTFVDVLGWLVSRIVLVGQWFDGQALGAAAAFAGATKQIMEVVGAGVDGLLKLAEFVKPAPGVIQTFADTLGWLVSRFVTVGGWFNGPALAAAGAFADSAGKVVGVIAAGVDGLLKLGEFVRPAPGVIDTFTGVVWWLVSRFAEAASWMTGKALQAAVAFAEGAGKVLGIIKAGIEGLNALRDFKAMLDPPLIAFANAVDAIVWLMYMVAEDVGTKAVDAAAKFSEGAGKVLGILKTGADGLGALRDFVMPGYEAMVAFSNGVDAIVWLMYMVAEDVSQQATDAAAKFSEAASKVFGTLKSGVDGLTALADLKPIGEGAIQLFVALVDRLITDIAAASESFSADALAQAQKFATAAGAAVGILEKGVQGLLEVNSFAGVSEEAITRFAEGVKLAVAAMARLAAEFGADAVAAAKAFAQAAGESTDFLKKGADGLNKISEFKEVPVAGLKVFADGIRAMVAMVLNLSTVVTEQMIADAVRFSVGMDQVIQVVAGGLKAFKDLGIAAMNIQAFMVNFGLAVAKLVTDFKNAAAPGAQNIGLAISLGIAAGITSGTPAIVSAVYAAINQVILAAKAALGIASPSKVFQQQIGLQMSAGMAGGVTMGAPLVDRAVTDVSGRAVASAAAAGGGGGSTLNVGGLTIVQQPGQNAQQLAQTVIAEIERRSKRRL